MNDDIMSKWIKERNRAVLSFDVETFKKFYKRWSKRGLYSMRLPSDEVIEISMRKGVVAMGDYAPKDKLEEAKKWLKERGYSEGL